MEAKEMVLKAEVRETGSKGKSNRLRKDGGIPAILYGGSQKNIPLSINGKMYHSVMHGKRGENAIMTLDFNDEGKQEKKNVLIKELQYHPVNGNILHIDFLEISLTKEIEVMVRIETVGVPAGVEVKGGVLDHTMREVKIRCLPTAIPEKIQIDVSALDIGDSLKVSNLIPPEKMAVVDDPEKIIAIVIPPSRIEEKPVEEAAVEGEVPAEPEVIAKGKKEEEAEETEKGKAEPEVIQKGKKETGEKEKEKEKK